MNIVKGIVMQRDWLSEDEFNDLVSEAKVWLDDGETPADVLQYIFWLEPDYVTDLLDLIEDVDLP